MTAGESYKGALADVAQDQDAYLIRLAKPRSYVVKEIFNTLQGEGSRAGTRAVFLRFAGCDLWNGREDGREAGDGACARFCDTDFVGGAKLSLSSLLALLDAQWPAKAGEQRWVVCTGGEPSLQIDRSLVEALHDARWKIAVETNGRHDNAAVRACDHICLSPKRERSGEQGWRRLEYADEVKVVLPGARPGEAGWSDAELEEIESWIDDVMMPAQCEGRAVETALFVQPQDPIAHATSSVLRGVQHAYAEQVAANTKRSVDFVMAHPRWRLSVQTHKVLGLR